MTDKKRAMKDPPIIAALFLHFPSIMLKLGFEFLKFKREAKKGGKIFRKELIEHGIDPKTASELSYIYLQSSNLRGYLP